MIFDNPTNLTRVTELLTTANEYASGYLGSIIFIVIGFGTFLLTSQFSIKACFVASSFVLLVTSLLLKFLFGLIGDIWLYASVVLFIASLAVAFAMKDNQGA